MSTHTRFCQGCNEKYHVPDGAAECPGCGQPLVPVFSAPTEHLLDLAMGGRSSRLRSDGGSRGVGGEPSDAADRGDPTTHFGSSGRRGDEDADERTDPLPGSRLGEYIVESFLGRGGMARVYLARHIGLQRPCALKVLSPRLAERDPYYVRLFYEEARSAAGLVHPNVVTVHNVGTRRSLHFIEMEYVHGRSLQSRVDAEGHLEPRVATGMMCQTSSALARAHEAGLVHRDLKPANILVDRDGVAKLADFGLAKKIISEVPGVVQRDLVGTPHFMAPELFHGEAAGPRSDVYALGVSFYLLLTGRLPFAATMLSEIIRNHEEAPVPTIGSIPGEFRDDLDGVVKRALSKAPEARFDSAREFHDELTALHGGMRTLEELVSRALDPLEVRWRAVGSRFVVEVPTGPGRSKTVIVESSTSGAAGQRLVHISGLCAPIEGQPYRAALELNAAIAHGAIAIRHVDGEPRFFVVNRYPRATCDPEEIRDSVLGVARWADHVERKLAGS